MNKVIKIVIVIIIFFFNAIKLSSLSVSNYSLSPLFDKDIYIYNVFTEEDREIISISHSESDNVSGNGTFSLKRGLNVFYVSIDNKIYTLNIYRGKYYSLKSNAYLKELKINNQDINFSYNVFDYYIQKDDDLSITYTLFNESSLVTIDEEEDKVVIEVTSEDLVNKNVYNIYFINKKDFKVQNKSDYKVYLFSFICLIFLCLLIILLHIFN